MRTNYTRVLKKRFSLNKQYAKIIYKASNKHIYIIAIDSSENLIFSLSSKDCFYCCNALSNFARVEILGKKLAYALLSRSIHKIFFDKSKKQFHGNFKIFVNTIIEEGINI